MRFSKLLIIVMALWILPTYGQTLTAPSVSLPQKRAAFDLLIIPRFADILPPTVWSEPCFCPESEPQCAQYYRGKYRGSLALPNYKSPVAPTEIQVIDFEGLKKLLQPDAKEARPLLVNFWATWCDPCREEFPDLVKIDADYRGKNLNFVTVSLDDVSEIGTEVPKFLKLMKATMRTVLLNVNDPEPAIKSVDAGWDGQLPATFLYDKDGKVVFRHFGKIKPDELRAAIDKQVKSDK
ncbi:MAG TPA: TlpA disulfide reductase family protein [Pyrinomonadaceae bacterium]|nr:TlpA disulfide reductase family protein [Pyrinomonadaceae bacterium]